VVPPPPTGGRLAAARALADELDGKAPAKPVARPQSQLRVTNERRTWNPVPACELPHRKRSKKSDGSYTWQ